MNDENGNESTSNSQSNSNLGISSDLRRTKIKDKIRKAQQQHKERKQREIAQLQSQQNLDNLENSSSSDTRSQQSQLIESYRREKQRWSTNTSTTSMLPKTTTTTTTKSNIGDQTRLQHQPAIEQSSNLPTNSFTQSFLQFHQQSRELPNPSIKFTNTSSNHIHRFSRQIPSMLDLKHRYRFIHTIQKLNVHKLQDPQLLQFQHLSQSRRQEHHLINTIVWKF